VSLDVTESLRARVSDIGDLLQPASTFLLVQAVEPFDGR
jgi:hypothetical protein